MATEVQTINLLSQNFMTVVQFTILKSNHSLVRCVVQCISYVLANTCDNGELTCNS